MGNIRDEISKNLLFYRKRSGMTQKELAELLGVKNSAVSNWEKGVNSIDIETLFKACTIFKISVNDMYGQYSNETVEFSDEIKDLVSIVSQLDTIDRAEIRGMMKQMLRADKYGDKSNSKLA